ncbi:MAG: M48 family metalloprotease [Candidatus Kerfeldbacteria bacterium]|nr:M48 family metalloprotease [Candidatus Kerfeldbacteria bacterium]
MARSRLHFSLISAAGLMLVAASLVVLVLIPRAFGEAANPCGCSAAALSKWLIPLFFLAAAVVGRMLYAVGKTGRETRAFLARELAGAVPVAATTLGVETPYPLMVLPNSSAVFCYGLLRPRIAIGEQIVRLMDRAQLRSVVAHETAHASSRDPLRLFVVSALGVLLGRWLGGPQVVRAFTLDVESDADQVAIRRYGRELLAAAFLQLLAAADQPSNRPVPALSVTEARILRLLGTERRPSLVWVAFLAVGIVLLGFLGLRATVRAVEVDRPPAVRGAMCARPPACVEPLRRSFTCYQSARTTVCVSKVPLESLSRLP